MMYRLQTLYDESVFVTLSLMRVLHATRVACDTLLVLFRRQRVAVKIGRAKADVFMGDTE